MDIDQNTTPDTAAKKEEPGKSVKPSKLFVEYYGSVVLLLIAILVGAGYLVIKPKLDNWKAMKTEAQIVREQAENDRQYYSGLSRSVSASESIDQTALSKLDVALPRKPLLTDLMVELGHLAKLSGVTMNSISFEAAKNNLAVSGLQSVNLSMTLEANGYQSLKNFMKSLERNLRILEITNVSFSSSEKGTLTFTLTAKVFYYPAKAESATSTNVGVATPQ